MRNDASHKKDKWPLKEKWTAGMRTHVLIPTKMPERVQKLLKSLIKLSPKQKLDLRASNNQARTRNNPLMVSTI